MKSAIAALVLLTVLAFTAPPPGCEPSGTQLFPCAVTRYSTPIKLSAALGAILMTYRGGGNYGGFFATVEPGFGGGKFNVGYRLGKHQYLPVYNVGLSASLMQTWGNPLGDVQEGQTYAGLELSGAFTIIVVNGGIFWHVAGDDEEHDVVYTLGVGCGI